ncbi:MULTISPECIES: hypothetical protein [Paenibacillus]|uniref:hypothetical protein n=1 Tax=Paenibacillus TaxID=44249 RepID=UPI0013E0B06D|nr:hypothetical protein [Paenibacillus whitsoniae]
MTANNANDDVVSHAINAAQENADNAAAQQQVQELASELNSSVANDNDQEDSSAQD